MYCQTEFVLPEANERHLVAVNWSTSNLVGLGKKIVGSHPIMISLKTTHSIEDDSPKEFEIHLTPSEARALGNKLLEFHDGPWK